MADSTAFMKTCEELEAGCSLDRLETRGTIRIALKAAGLAANSVTPDEMKVVLTKVLPEELVARGITDADQVCKRVADSLAGLESQVRNDTPEAVFGRLGG